MNLDFHEDFLYEINEYEVDSIAKKTIVNNNSIIEIIDDCTGQFEILVHAINTNNIELVNKIINLEYIGYIFKYEDSSCIYYLTSWCLKTDKLEIAKLIFKTFLYFWNDEYISYVIEFHDNSSVILDILINENPELLKNKTNNILYTIIEISLLIRNSLVFSKVIKFAYCNNIIYINNDIDNIVSMINDCGHIDFFYEIIEYNEDFEYILINFFKVFSYQLMIESINIDTLIDEITDIVNEIKKEKVFQLYNMVDETYLLKIIYDYI